MVPPAASLAILILQIWINIPRDNDMISHGRQAPVAVPTRGAEEGGAGGGVGRSFLLG